MSFRSSCSANVLSYADDSNGAAIGGALLGIPIALVIIAVVFFSFWFAGIKRMRLLRHMFPKALLLPRVLYSATSDAAIQRLGGQAADRPGMEYVSTAFGSDGVLIVDRNSKHIVQIPATNVVGVKVGRAPMVHGSDRLCLILEARNGEFFTQVPLLPTSNSWIPLRSLNYEEPLFARLVVSQFTISEGKRDVDQCGVHGG